MYELKQVGPQSYYINSPAKIGIYRQSENEVYLIDSGNDKEAAKKVLKIAGQNGWRIKGIITPHSNADHIEWFYFRKMGTNIGDMSTFPPFMLPYLCGQ